LLIDSIIKKKKKSKSNEKEKKTTAASPDGVNRLHIICSADDHESKTPYTPIGSHFLLLHYCLPI
jgi:hypothetical protein